MRESISAVGIYKARYSKNSNAVGICARCSKSSNAVGICVAEMRIPTEQRLQEALEHAGRIWDNPAGERHSSGATPL